MNIFELFGTIAIDNAKANKAISDTGNKASGLSNTMEAAFGKIGNLAKKVGTAVVAAFAVDKIKDFGKDCAETYASIAAEQASFEQIMGDYAYMAQEKMDKVASETGMVSSRLTPYMTSMTAKFKGLGFGVDEATSLAQEGLTIAADASAFWDKSLDESMSHLNSFINGSYEGGEAIGLFANDTQMAAYAVKNGIVKNTKAWSSLDEATKQATRLQYAKDMMAQSGATGQAAKESGEYANVLANLNEHMRQLKGIIGKPILEKLILPVMRALNKIMPGLTKKTEAFMTGFSNGLDKVAGYFKDVFTEEGLNLSALPDAFSKMFSAIARKVPVLLSTLGKSISGAWKGRVWPIVQKLFKTTFNVELPSWDDLTAKIRNGWNNIIWPSIQGFFKTTFGVELPKWGELATAISNKWNNEVLPKIQNFFKEHFEIELPKWETLASDIKTNLESLKKSAKEYLKLNFDIDIPDWDTTSAYVLENIQSFVTDVTELLNKIYEWATGDGAELLQGVLKVAGAFMLVSLAAGAVTNPLLLIIALTALVIANWNAVKEAVTNAFNTMIEWLSTNIGAPLETFRKNVIEPLAGYWNDTIVPAIKGAATAVGDFFGIDLVAGWDSITNAISSAWNSVTSAIDAATTAISNFFGVKGNTGLGGGDARPWYVQENPGQYSAQSGNTFGGGTSTGTGGGKSIPGHANGLDFVPRDGYLARLHYGETVLNRANADAWRSGTMGSAEVGRLETAINALSGLMQQMVANTRGGQQIVLDSGVLVGQLAPRMDEQLGTISGRKGRRN